jgi:hypothetical protein
MSVVMDAGLGRSTDSGQVASGGVPQDISNKDPRMCRLPAARICLAVAVAVLSIAITFDMVGSKPAFGASQHVLRSHERARHAKCAKATHRKGEGDIARKPLKQAAGKRSCAAHHTRSPGPTADPVLPAPPMPTTAAVDDPEIAPGNSAPSGSSKPTGVHGGHEETPVEPPPVEPTTPFRFFSPNSVWNAPLPANAPLDPSSAAVVGAFDEEIAREDETRGGPANINTTEWSVPIYTVPADQPTVKVALIRLSLSPALQTAWSAVPLPANAQPAAGSDEHLVVWQPSTDRLWEFWGLADGTNGWYAFWGGAMQNASSNPGVYSSEAWPGALSSWGASASSLSIAGGLITLEDLERGQIDHALAIAIPHPRAGVYASPAQRTDGTSTNPLSLPEGAHLRLDPNLDLAALQLPPLTLMLAEAAQRYGIVVRDRAGNMAFYAQDPTPTGTNPYTGTQGYFEGKSPQRLLASFPWSHLQLLKMELHGTS